MLRRLVTFFSDAPSQWWQHFNNDDDDDPTCLLFTLCLLVFVLSLFKWILFIKKSRNRYPPLPPGPRGLPLVGNLLSLDPQLHTYLTSLAQTYGPILTLWLGKKLTLVVTSQALAREILKDRSVIFANRDIPASAVQSSYGCSDVVWSQYGAEWRMLRKVAVHEMLSNTTLDSVYSLRRQEIRKTIGYVHSQAGTRVNIGIEKKMKGLVKRLDVIFDGMIDQRSKTNGEGGTSAGDGAKQSKDFLEFLLQLKDEGDAKTPLTMIHVKALLMDMVVGGTDTTSNAIEFAMAEMMNKPEVMQRVKQELDTAVGKNNKLEESHIPKLPYLYAVMKEALRLHPILPLLVPHSPSETCIIGGYTIPKGARILINVWAIQRDPSIWENPLEFDPERFLNGRGDFSGKECWNISKIFNGY